MHMHVKNSKTSGLFSAIFPGIYALPNCSGFFVRHTNLNGPICYQASFPIPLVFPLPECCHHHCSLDYEHILIEMNLSFTKCILNNIK